MYPRRKLLAPAIIGCAVLSAGLDRTAPAVTAAGIMLGEADGERHPYVCAVFGTWIGPDANFGETVQRCSGVMIAPDVMVTAGHCARAVPRIANEFVTCGPELRTESQRIYGFTRHQLPGWRPDYAVIAPGIENFDLGVLRLPERPAGLTRVARPARPGFLEDVFAAGSPPVTAVGYGAEGFGAGLSLFWPGRGVRRNGTLSFEALVGSYLLADPAPGIVMFGDSGGPALLADSHQLLGVLSTTANDNPWRAAYYRVDTEPARAFLRQFVELPED